MLSINVLKLIETLFPSIPWEMMPNNISIFQYGLVRYHTAESGKMDPHLLRVAREDASKTFADAWRCGVALKLTRGLPRTMAVSQPGTPKPVVFPMKMNDVGVRHFQNTPKCGDL